jgi:DNA-binding NarL/FixJ family response regulator
MLHPFFKKKLESYGFSNVAATALDNDALDNLLRELKPRLVIIEARYYECSTPFMVSELLNRLPELNLNIAAVSIERYPAKRGMAFISNGVKSFACFADGEDEFEKGMRLIRDGGIYISPTLQEKNIKGTSTQKEAGNITPRHCEIIRLNCNGFTASEICKTLHMAESTLYNHKKEIFNCLAVRNEREMIRAARAMGIINDDELVFNGGNIETEPRKRKPYKKRTIETNSRQRRTKKLATGGNNDCQKQER